MEQRATIKRMEGVNVRRLPDDRTPDEEALLSGRIIPLHERLAGTEHAARLRALGNLELFA